MTARDTSIKAYEEIKRDGALSPRRMEIYDVLFHYGPLTANEIFKRIIGRSSINQANVPARLNEMREMGCVKEVGTRACSVTKMEVILWDCTRHYPTRVKRADKIKCPTCKGKGHIEQGRLL